MVELSELKDKWNNLQELELYSISLVDKQFSLANLIASEEQNLNNTFIMEREDAYKGTDSMAKARAKQLVGTKKTVYEYTFEAINSLLEIVNARISQLRLQQPLEK